MDLMRRRRALMMVAKKARLPGEYQETAWIQTPDYPNDISAYACTGIPNNLFGSVVCKYECISIPSWANAPTFLAAHELNSTTAVLPLANMNDINGYYRITPTVTKPFDGKVEEFTVQFRDNQENYVRIGSWNTGVWSGTGRYYYVMGYDKNGVEIANFVPCYRISDNIAGFYELHNNIFYQSNGPYDFIKGPEV